MKYFTLFEIITSLGTFLLFGAILGALSGCLKLLISKVFGLMKLIILSTRFENVKKLKNELKNRAEFDKPSIIFINDFVLYTSFSLLFIILSYVCLDGYFRLFSLIFYILGFCLARKFIGNAFFEIVNNTMVYTDIIFALIIRALYTPLSFIVKLINKHVIGYIEKKIIILRSKRIFSKKCEEVYSFFGE